MRARYIYEKFTDDSDPIIDMGIGLFAHHVFDNENKFFDFLINAVIPGLIGDIPKDILQGDGIIRPDIYSRIDGYLDKYITYKGRSASSYYFHDAKGYWNYALRDKLIQMGYKEKDYKRRKK